MLGIKGWGGVGGIRLLNWMKKKIKRIPEQSLDREGEEGIAARENSLC